MGRKASPAPAAEAVWWALLQALGENDVATVARLVDEGADLAREDGLGRHALVTAAQSGDTSLVAAVLRGDNPRLAVDRALIEAAARGHASVVDVLLDAGADAAFTTERGNSALGIARKRRRKDVVALLLARGVTVDATRAVKRSVPAPPNVEDHSTSSHAGLVTPLRANAAAKRRSAAKKIGATRDSAFEGVLVAALARELEDVRAWEGQVEMARALGVSSSDLAVAAWLERVFVEVRFESTMVSKALAAAAYRIEARASRGGLDRILARVLDDVPTPVERLAACAGILEVATESSAKVRSAVARRVGAFIADPGDLPPHGEAMLEHARRAWAAHVKR